MTQSLDYAKSGVDINAGNKAVNLIKEQAEKTLKHFPGKILSGIGGFSGIVELSDRKVMGLATDGVGTKLVLSIVLDRHETVGIDLVAMCVNDLAVAGLTPAAFLDYIAMGKQIPQRTQKIVNGIIEGCHQAECALLGGEMAEMPDMYSEQDYDLAGFAVGFANSKEDLITGNKIKVGMKIYGLPSSGVHSNGYSLARKTFEIDLKKTDETKKILNTNYPELDRTLGEELMEPTKIYVKEIKKMISNYDIAGLAHITGGGLIENIPRILPENCSALINKGSWEVPAIFKLIERKGNISKLEMMKTFNYGIGLVVITNDTVENAFLIGEIVYGENKTFIK
ncbi:MAG: phosphoribosylformylglycinamidine cyclo-ligase [Candidatus Pacebacteria bacterium]|nr:phosphoribosylformylglycinamidine cyclo-ligase [Candidatus Paceibacterota bacterium]